MQPDGWLRLSVHGELDVATAALLEDQLRDARRGRRCVRVDLSELAFLDSTGLHAILRCLREARSDAVTVEIERSVSNAVAALLSLTDAERLLWPDAELSTAPRSGLPGRDRS